MGFLRSILKLLLVTLYIYIDYLKDFTTVACQMDFPGLHDLSTPQVLSAGYHMGFFQGNGI